MTTITEIAKKLGVAPSTVSRALRDSREVSPEVRQRVKELAAQMNYTPNLLARGLVRARTETIGTLILEFANPFFVPVIQAIEEVVEARGYSVMISQSHRKLEDEKRVLKHFEMVRVSGVILTPTLQEVGHLANLKQRGLPLVVIGRTADGLDSISTDNQEGGALVGRHFIEYGHREIGVVASGEAFNTPEQQRIAGLEEEIQQAGLVLRPKWRFRVGSSDIEGGLRAAETWLSLADRPSAVFCTVDRLAIGFIQGIQKAGLNVPADVAVAGFDDIPLSEYLRVPLTTVAYPKYSLGKLAAERLVHLIENPQARFITEHILINPYLIVRESSGGKI